MLSGKYPAPSPNPDSSQIEFSRPSAPSYWGFAGQNEVFMCRQCGSSVDFLDGRLGAAILSMASFSRLWGDTLPTNSASSKHCYSSRRDSYTGRGWDIAALLSRSDRLRLW